MPADELRYGLDGPVPPLCCKECGEPFKPGELWDSVRCFVLVPGGGAEYLPGYYHEKCAPPAVRSPALV